MKTAAQLGLCKIRKYKCYLNAITPLYNSLGSDKKNALRAKFCLFMPFIQNYYYYGGNEKTLRDLLSILSPTTQVRRRSNCRTIIEIVEQALDYDI